nr:UDP-glycosyltransferase 83A1-like [Tanacetum cinerariifolium]
MKTWLEKECFGPLMNMVSIPDGMEAWEDRNNFIRTCEAINQVMPGKLEELIETINKKDDDKISCVIADETIFQLSSTMPPMSTAEFGWACMGTLETTKILFKYAIAAVDADNEIVEIV